MSFQPVVHGSTGVNCADVTSCGKLFPICGLTTRKEQTPTTLVDKQYMHNERTGQAHEECTVRRPA